VKKIVTVNRKSAMGLSRSYWCSTYIITKSPKGWLKKRFFCFLIKLNFNRIKSATKILYVKTFGDKVVV